MACAAGSSKTWRAPLKYSARNLVSISSPWYRPRPMPSGRSSRVRCNCSMRSCSISSACRREARSGLSACSLMAWSRSARTLAINCRLPTYDHVQPANAIDKASTATPSVARRARCLPRLAYCWTKPRSAKMTLLNKSFKKNPFSATTRAETRSARGSNANCCATRSLARLAEVPSCTELVK